MTNPASTKPLKIAYLGPSASFSNQAAAEAFPDDVPRILQPLPSFKAIFTAIQDSSEQNEKSFDFAVVPIENSTNGGVVQVFDLLIQCGLDPGKSQFPDVEVVAEHYLQVHHCLFVHPDALRLKGKERDIETGVGTHDGLTVAATSKDPISDLHITTIYSHPQVWGQCNNFLTEHFPPAQTERQDLDSTSAAAVWVAQHPPDSNSNGVPAAICSLLAGEQNGLALVVPNIEDEPGKNTTRFLIIRNRHLHTEVPTHLQVPMLDSRAELTYRKSLIAFIVQHTSPGSLASALNVFSTHDLNLTTITTRPSREQNWNYVFFVECKHEAATSKDISHTSVQKLLPDLEKVTDKLCWLGTWTDRLGLD